MEEILHLQENSSWSCEDIREKAEAKIASVETKIAMLKKMKQALTELSAACKGRTSLGECPILEFLDKGGVWNEGRIYLRS